MRKTLAIHEGSSIVSSSYSEKSLSVHILIAIFSFITALLSESSSILIGATNSGLQQHDSSVAPLLPRPDPSGRPQLMVAVYCGTAASSSLYYNQYLDPESRKWRSDRGDPLAVCTRDKQAILSYCKKVYPTHDIRNIVESSRSYRLDNWCRLGASSKRHCRARLTVKPYRCLEGTFQSDALLVPERCVFDHVHNKSVCENPNHWNKSASDICHLKGMKLQSFGMLQPCGLDVFSGVEFVCCPTSGGGSDRSSSSRPSSASKSNDQSEGNSFAQAANGVLPNLPKNQPRYETDASNEIKTDDDAPKRLSDDSIEASSDESNNSNDDEDEDEEYDEEPDEDSYDDDSTKWNNGDKASSTTSTTTTTTTTTTERPIERYLSHFDLAHEHDDFKRAELAVEGSYRDKMLHVMREWGELDGRYEEMKRKGDPEGAEEFKRKMTHQYKKTIDALESESAAQRHQLASMHAERAMAIINRRKKTAMDCLTQALDRVPIRSRQVERCIVRLLKALEKDRSHTLRQYKNLLNLNTREALKERKIILDHLVTLNRAANQSIAMLDRSPKLVEKLKTKIDTIWHKLRGVPLDEPIVRESEEKIMDQYEEEAAKQKIERERKRLTEQESNQPDRSEPSTKIDAANDATKVSNNGDEKATDIQKSGSSIGGSSYGVHLNQLSTPQSRAPKTLIEANNPIDAVSTESTTTPVNQPMSFVVAVGEPQTSSSPLQSKQATNSANEMDTNKKERVHYQAEPVGFAHLRSEEAYHELSYSVRHEPLHGHLKFGYSAALVSSFAAIILLAFIGVKYYGKSSRRAYRRQGFAEVGRNCPEEKSVTHMQFNGYENPAYKYFGAEA